MAFFSFIVLYIFNCPYYEAKFSKMMTKNSFSGPEMKFIDGERESNKTIKKTESFSLIYTMLWQMKEKQQLNVDLKKNYIKLNHSHKENKIQAFPTTCSTLLKTCKKKKTNDLKMVIYMTHSQETAKRKTKLTRINPWYQEGWCGFFTAFAS